MIKIIKFLVICNFKNIYNFDKTNVNNVSEFIMNSILKLSWFFKFPILIYLYTLQCLATIIKFKSISKFSEEQQYYFYNTVFMNMPFSNSVEKLIRTLGFMALYDENSNG